MNGHDQSIAVLEKPATVTQSLPFQAANYYDAAKRVMDILITILLSPIGLPLAAVIAVLIKLDSRGDVFYVTQVIGYRGQSFNYYKFRTMRPGSNDSMHREYVERNMRDRTPSGMDENGNPIFKTAHTDASRITRIGGILRRTSLDELPQFWNVLCGEMSVVGPRPAMPYEAQLYNEEQRRRFDMLPGITGWYQVNARNQVAIADMISLDLEYMERRSLFLDLWIMLQTPLAMLRGL